jgi:hypothetical protein
MVMKIDPSMDRLEKNNAKLIKCGAERKNRIVPEPMNP